MSHNPAHRARLSLSLRQNSRQKPLTEGRVYGAHSLREQHTGGESSWQECEAAGGIASAEMVGGREVDTGAQLPSPFSQGDVWSFVDLLVLL